MEHTLAHNPALTLAIAMAAGMVAQALARHLKIPGIVLLLAAGALLGPDGLGLVQPATMGPALMTLVGFAVAIILFEGGLNLNVQRLRREATVIRRLVTVGALITTVGGALLAFSVMGWSWRTALLFGTLVSVTGPTVITPLLRRIHLTHNLSTILEAEGVFVDAIGAVLAVAALEVAVSPPAESIGEGVGVFVSRLGLGAVLGLVGGLIIAWLLRFEFLVPEGMENILTLSLVLVMYQVSHAVLPESGIVAAPVAGVVVGNIRTRALRDLMDFKEQLTMLLIGLLFVLLAADVRLADILALGVPGLITVLALMLIVRPVNVAVSTAGSTLTTRERAFLAWLAPRGIVAAAVASLFAAELGEAAVAGANELRALVFLVIAVTVLVQGLSGGLVANLLGVRRAMNSGYVILGANALGLALGRILRDHEERVVFIDSSPNATQVAEKEGFRVLWGNALDDRVRQRAELEIRRGVIAVTPNDELNLMFLRCARTEHKVPNAYTAVAPASADIHLDLVDGQGGKVLFGAPQDSELWTVRLYRARAQVEAWQRTKHAAGASEDECIVPDDVHEALLPLVWVRNGTATPIDERYRPRENDIVYFAVFQPEADRGRTELMARGWVPAV
jgi:NhaP-type Na+/H+ or K+/H+ antiporter